MNETAINLSRGWKIRFTLLALLALAFLVPNGRADSDTTKSLALPVVDRTELRFSRLTTQDGLSQTRVTQIVQDDRGFLWFGTQFGLNRFDGYKFRVFVHDPNQANSLGGVYISALFKDRSGKLWVGCSQSLDCLDPVTEQFTHFKLEADNPMELSGRVVNISQDSDGMIWLASGTGLHRLNPASGQIEHFRHRAGDATSLSSNDVKSSGMDRHGRFWIGTSEGMDEFDRTKGIVTTHVAITEPLHIGFYEDRFGTFWIYSTAGSGLATYDRDTRQLTKISLGDQSIPEGPPLTGVRAMVEDDQGQLWLGSFGSGLLKYDRENQRFVRYLNNAADPESLADNNVIALYKDREGNIWTGLHSSGPSHFSTQPPRFEQFQRDATSAGKRGAKFINALYEDRRGRLWMGGDDALISLDRTTGRTIQFSAGLDSKPTIIAIAEDKNGAIWVGTYRHGLARLDEKTGRFEVFRHRNDDPSSLSNDAVHRIFIDHLGNMWIGTNDGLNRFDPERQRFEVYKVDADNHWSQSYVAISEDARGILWLGSIYSGLHRFDPATGKFVVYRSASVASGSIADDTVPGIVTDEGGMIWVGTQIGLGKMDTKTGVFTPCLDGGQPLGRSIDCLLRDRRGHLWMSTNKGLSEYDPATQRFSHYSAADGLPGNDLTGWGAGCLGGNGTMYFGGFDGGVVFDPVKAADDPFIPALVLTDFRLPYAPQGNGIAARLSKGIVPVDQLSLSHDENSFSLEFAALSYFNAKTNRYRYKLEGLDRQWNEVSSDQRSATYTTLQPASYTFRAQGATARGRWSEPGVVFTVEVLPPWWRTRWFTVGMVLALSGLLAGGIRIRIEQVKRRERDFRTLADNAPDMVMRFGRDARFLYVNSAVENYTRLSRETTRGKKPAQVANSSRPLPVSEESIVEVFRTRSPMIYETVCASDLGKSHFETRLVPELDDHGQPKSVLVISRDISEQKRAEDSLRETRDELGRVSRIITVGELTASIAHEVNQPLGAIVTNGQACLRWLNREVPNLTEIRTCVEQMLRDGIRGSEVVIRIRALVKKEAPMRAPVCINELIREIGEMISMPAERATLHLEFGEALPLVIADRIQLQQVFLNLMKNALEAMESVTGRERVLLIRTGDGPTGLIQVEVIDNGSGLPAGQAQRLFEPFYTTKPDGLGMGLSICRSIIESHGGKLWAKANAAEGMTFSFTLPSFQEGAT